MSKNEKKFYLKVGKIVKKPPSFGYKKEDEVYISADFAYLDEDLKKLYLIEIESDNKAKVSVGEYVLLNMLYEYPNEKNGTKKLVDGIYIENCYFLTILAHDDNTPERVNNVLNLVKENYGLKMNYMTIRLNSFSSQEEFLNIIKHN